MKHLKLKYIILPAIVFALFSCSAKKNTWLSRNYQSFSARFNVKFNGQNSFDNGQKIFFENHKDDYSEILPLYPDINAEQASVSASQMDVTIEKCRKVIKLHSIRAKPKKRPLGMGANEYRIYRNQEEYNPQVQIAWLLLGKAELFKAEFLGAISDFNYIIRHYSENKRLVMEAKLWKVRSYTAMGWLNESESELLNIKEKDVDYSLTPLYNAFKADLFVEQKQYEKAILPLEYAIKNTKSRGERARFNFVLAQIYELKGDRKKANFHYLEAKRKAQNYEMIFNAQLKATINQTNSAKAIKELGKMAKSGKNKTYLDQIYYYMGNRYLEVENIPKAIESYKLAVSGSTRNGLEKSIAALALAKLYYNNREYIFSAQYYDTVVRYMPNSYKDFKEAEQKASLLGELAQNHNIVVLQDSLLHLATLSEDQQMAIVKKIIEDVENRDRQAAKDSADRSALSLAQSFDTSSDLNFIGASSAEWYFYNSDLLRQGKSEFNRLWARRPLEDNWRRETKILSVNMQDETVEQQLQQNDSTAPSTDRYSPEHYLSQIPKTEEQKRMAKSQIATALYDMGAIFMNKLKDDNSAYQTYLNFQNRFPEDDRICETLYFEYMISGRLNNLANQGEFREKLLSRCEGSKYSTMLLDPNYTSKLTQMLRVQDSLYVVAYKEYTGGQYIGVMNKYRYMTENFPMSELMPKFEFLNALSIAKTGSQAELERALDSLILKFGNSDVAPISRDILAVLRQGRESDQTTTTTTLAQQRTAQNQEEDNRLLANETFETNNSEPQSIMFISKNNDKKLLNNLLYDIAAYNFNKFLIKDYDFEIMNFGQKAMIILSGFETADEANWYKNIIDKDQVFAGNQYISEFYVYILSNTNLRKINSEASLINYLQFVGTEEAD